MSGTFNPCASDTRMSGLPRGSASRLLAGLKTIVLWPARVIGARRELEMLAGMSENELKDIGLTSSDLGDATALAAHASPTKFLAARVEERHRFRQGFTPPRT